MDKRRITSCLVGLVLCALSACEIDTKLTVKGNNVPIFFMSGNGRLDSFFVEGNLPQRNYVGRATYFYWQIKPQPGTSGKKIYKIESVEYGKVPAGYVQVYPEPGTPLPPLVEGIRYYVHADTSNANGVGKYFIINNGKAEEIVTR